MDTENLRNILRTIPLLGGLADCDLSDHREALGQTFIVLLFSTAPLWLAALIVYGTGDDLAGSAFLAALKGTVANGELYMYCTALLAPIFWIALVDMPGARAFPSKISHMVLIAIIEIVAALFFGLISAGKHLNDAFKFKTSLYMFELAVLLLYLGTVYHISRIAEATTEFKKQETDFTEKLRERRT